jgi:hypothetical protein
LEDIFFVYSIRFVVGDDGEAVSLLGILPARKALRPDSTASFIASAIKIGFLACAIAVFIKIPSQPNSIAIAASEAVPTPASTMIGLDEFSKIISML